MLNQLVLAGALAAALPLLPQQSPPRDATHRITVIGCIKRSQPDTAATTGTTALEPGQTRYVLTTATLADDRDRSVTTGAVAMSASTYRLDDGQDASIAPHVDEKVQVVGTVESANTSARETHDTTAAPAMTPVLKVEKLQPIAGSSESCGR